jgi:hypothetical protein
VCDAEKEMGREPSLVVRGSADGFAKAFLQLADWATRKPLAFVK